ncbi:MAG: serine/threonine protein kinase, partial [Myxococcales bacterium]|nr:serine/threonine protein kinase [Myxococcales bacterium]
MSSLEQTRYVQGRVALFLRAWTFVSAVGVLLRVASALAGGGEQGLLRGAPFQYQLAALAAVLVPWLLVRGGERSSRLLRVVESLSLHATAMFLALMGASITVEIHGAALREVRLGETGPPVQDFLASLDHQYAALIVVFIVTGMLVLRAALVPSTSTRTAALALGIGVVGFVAYGLAGGAPLSAHDMVVLAVGTGAFYAFAIVLSVILSHVIHGLREEVRTARELGQYTLEKKIGEGGMGVVYQASHAMLRRPTAVKLLPPDKVGERTIERFEREVQLTAQLTHPNTVTVFDYGRTPEGVFYYAMELLDGPNLEQLVEAGGPQSESRVVYLLTQVCGALDEAHGLGLIHRDIKPANILLVQRGGRYDVSKVVDFGLVKEVRRDGDSAITHDGVITGTPMYLAPEALKAPDTVDARSDLYALGAVAYFLLVGEPVFTGDTVVEICAHHLHSEPEPPSQRLGRPIDAGLEALVLRCLAKDPAARPESAAALGEALGALEIEPWTSADAEAWWRDHGGIFRARRAAEGTSTHGATVTIDLATRHPR